MQVHSKLQKWGNSSAIRISKDLLAAAGISPDSEIDIQAGNGRLVIQLPESTQEQLFDKLLSELPDAGEVLAMVQESLSRAIQMTDESTKNVNRLCAELTEKHGGKE